MTKRHIILAIGILAASLFSSCSASDHSFETRRQFAIQSTKDQLASAKNEVRVKWEHDILNALATVAPRASDNPKTAAAVIGNGKSGTYGLFVFWIENQPSVDSIELRLANGSSPVVIHIPEPELVQMRAAAKDTIVFGSEYEWTDSPEMSNALDRITSPKGLEVRLLRAATPVTDWFPVDLYKGGRWISDVITNK